MKLNKKAIDWLVLILIPISTAIIAKVFHTSLLLEVFLFFGLPPTYLFFRNPTIIKKTVIFSLVAWWPLTIVWEYLVYVDNIWFVPSAYRFFRGSLPLEDIPWGIQFLIYGISVWEYFFNKSRLKGRLFPPRYKYLVAFLYVPLVIFFILYYLSPETLYVPYFFLWLGLIYCVIPPVLFVIFRPKFLKRLVLMSVYFFIPFSLMDYTALTQNQWWFPGQHYIGVVSFFGHTLPLEEIIFFWILCMPALACWYEYFADDQK